jgi:transcriptional regulator with XRE-family HTH domain
MLPLGYHIVMAKHPKPRPTYQPTFLRQWRRHRNKTQQQLAEALGISDAQVARIENGKRPYTQPFLEAAAEYLETDAASLIMRDPTDPENIWSLWDRVEPVKRDDVRRILETFARKDKDVA